jgi:flap endonuclease-1
LNKLDINLEQLICLAILVGTDYNIGGVKGLGQKRALEIVQQYKIPAEIFKAVEKNPRYEINFNWNDIFSLFYRYESNNPNIVFKKFNSDKIKEILSSRDFSIERIESGIEKIKALEEQKKQKGLTDFLK